MAMQTASDHAAIAAMGHALGQAVLTAVHELYRGEQDAQVLAQPRSAVDLPYGDDPRHRLDLYKPHGAREAVSVLLWVHGGGFVRGGKWSPEHPYNAHVGRWAARNGFLGAVMNYRLAPTHGWPAGGEDVALAIDWLRRHAGDHGGDPDRIVVMGTSAGAVHIATMLRLRPNAAGARATILLSGLYGFTPPDDRDGAYYGPPEVYAERAPRTAMIATDVPLMLAFSEYDPPRFRAETIGLIAARPIAAMPRIHVASGHNHFSLACHIGSTDTRLSDEILAFVDQTLAQTATGETCS